MFFSPVHLDKYESVVIFFRLLLVLVVLFESRSVLRLLLLILALSVNIHIPLYIIFSTDTLRFDEQNVLEAQ